MGTAKPKLQGYVREDLFREFENERRALSLSQSQALEKVLSERYKTPSAAANSPDRESLYWIIKSMEDLQERIKKLEISNPESESLGNLDSNPESESLGNLDSNLESESLGNPESESPGNLDSNPESESPGNLDSNPESESLGNLESESLGNLDSNPESESPGNLDSNPESESLGNLESESLGNLDSNLESESLGNLPSKSKLAKGLGQRALAKRLSCSYQALTNAIILGDGDIESWSKRQDPQGIGWELRDKKYYPCNLSSTPLIPST